MIALKKRDFKFLTKSNEIFDQEAAFMELWRKDNFYVDCAMEPMKIYNLSSMKNLKHIVDVNPIHVDGIHVDHNDKKSKA